MKLPLPNFVELKKYSKKHHENIKKQKLAVVGNSSTQHISTAIQGYAYYKGINLEVYDSLYNQLEGQFLDYSSSLYKFEPDYILIYLSPEDLYEKFIQKPDFKRSQFAEDISKEIANYWQSIKKYSKAKIIQTLIMEKNDSVFGNFASTQKNSFVYQIRLLNFLISENITKSEDVYILDTLTLQAKYGYDSIFDANMYYIGKLTLSLDFLPVFAKMVIDIVFAINGKIKKCLVLDLDNTLWGGVIGDDGLENIQIGDIGIGGIYTDIQNYAKELKKRGIILAVCSKNEESTAKKPFEKHPDMILNLDDIAIFIANWENKADNIKNIQKELNIGMDSIVFIDDNKFERNLVKEVLPDVEVPDLPDNPSFYLEYIKSLNLFETISYSDEDKVRAEQYKIEAKRKSVEQSYTDYTSYLKDLDMKCISAEFDDFNTSRIAQLTQRSNQFNLRTVRYTVQDVKDIINSKDRAGLYFKLSDKYGDYGLVSVVILDIKKDEIFIDTYLMSCRALKRGLEEYVINRIINYAKEKNIQKIVGEYIPTQKNIIVKNLYKDFGFREIGDNKWEITTDDYVYKDNYIQEVDSE